MNIMIVLVALPEGVLDDLENHEFLWFWPQTYPQTYININWQFLKTLSDGEKLYSKFDDIYMYMINTAVLLITRSFIYNWHIQLNKSISSLRILTENCQLNINCARANSIGEIDSMYPIVVTVDWRKVESDVAVSYTSCK